MLNLPSIDKHDAEPVSAQNLPYQKSLVYRTDDYSSLRFKLLQHLEEAFPNWNRMLAEKTGLQDFGVAFIEMFSYMADVLGFYQNCKANESFLRTATLQASLIELCRLIDYSIPPGASASALQAFFLKPGQSGTIPTGFKIKNKPQPPAQVLVFETVEDLNASADLNTLFLRGYNRSELRLSETGVPAESSVLLDQSYAGLKAGQFVVVTCPGKNSVPLRLLAVEDESGKRRIRWKPGELPDGLNLPLARVVVLGKSKQQMKLAASLRADEISSGQSSVAVETPHVFHRSHHHHHHHHPAVFISEGFKQATNILHLNNNVVFWAPTFGLQLRRSQTTIYSAGELMLTYGGTLHPGDTVVDHSPSGLAVGDSIILRDSANAFLTQVSGISWSQFTVTDPLLQGFPNGAQVFRVILPDAETGSHGKHFTAVSPVRLSPTVHTLVLDKTYDNLVAGQQVVISDGEFTIVRKLAAVEIDSQQRTVLTLVAKIHHPFNVANTVVHGPFELQMRVDGYNKSTASLTAGVSSISLDGQVKGLAPGRRLILESSSASEGARISQVQLHPHYTHVDLEGPLQNSFPLSGTTVMGNVALVTQGATVIESPLGSGDQSKANQQFALHQGPTTYVHDIQGVTGVKDTLQVFVGDEEWLEVPSLAESGSGDHHVMVQIDEDQKMSFIGGDGKHGAAFPTGSNNISVRYRTGLGAAGNLSANALSVLAAPLPFVDTSRNPVPGNGGADAQTIEVTRQMAPVTVRTLDRAVTALDFKELALTYPGIDKANARYLRKDGRPLVDLVVATTGGLALNSEMRDSLTAFLQARSAPDHLVVIRDYTPVAVRLALEAHIRPTFLRAETGVTIQKALSTGLAEDGSLGYFNFDKRGLGEDLYLSDVYALVESLPGVDFLIVKEFRKQASGNATKLVNDVLSMPHDGVATGGDATDTGIGILAITLVGGLA
jgi:hypothetical protein